MAWGYLVLAGLFEVVWAIGLKYSEGFTRPWPSTVTVLSICASMGLLALALKSIPVGTGYAVWTGIGIAGTAMLGMVMFAESASVKRVLSLILIVDGILGVRESS